MEKLRKHAEQLKDWQCLVTSNGKKKQFPEVAPSADADDS